MSDIKMSDVFELPMEVYGYTVRAQPYTPSFSIEAILSEVECDSGKDADYVAHAINNHDKLVQERDELLKLIRKMIKSQSGPFADQAKSYWNDKLNKIEGEK